MRKIEAQLRQDESAQERVAGKRSDQWATVATIFMQKKNLTALTLMKETRISNLVNTI